MNDPIDAPNVVVHPPIAWAVAVLTGLGLGWLLPLHFIPTSVPHAWIGTGVFAAGFILGVWSVVTIRRAGTRVETYKPTTAIVAAGPFRMSRNPIYIGILLGQTGLAIGLDNLWMLAILLPFYFTIRYGVVAREEAYLERKFGGQYLSYKSHVRRWL
jgi:protein-S-isoprenylcysteine O-methyltransferase Ste14